MVWGMFSRCIFWILFTISVLYTYVTSASPKPYTNVDAPYISFSLLLSPKSAKYLSPTIWWNYTTTHQIISRYEIKCRLSTFIILDCICIVGYISGRGHLGYRTIAAWRNIVMKLIYIDVYVKSGWLGTKTALFGGNIMWCHEQLNCILLVKW